MQGQCLTSKDITVLVDQMDAEARLNRKAALYARNVTDPQLKDMANMLAQHHKQCYDALYNYLGTQQ